MMRDKGRTFAEFARGCGSAMAVLTVALLLAAALAVTPPAEANSAVDTSFTRSLPTHTTPFEVLNVSKAVTVTTSSQTLAELLGTSIDDDAIKLQFVNRDSSTAVYFATDTEATATHARLAAGENIVLRNAKADLDSLEFLAASDTVVADVLIWIWKQAE